jgi:cytochrome c oxidase subunit 2
MVNKVYFFIGALLLSLFAFPLDSFAQDALQAAQAQLGFQDAVTPVAEEIHKFHNMMMYIITAVTIFVLLLMLYVVVRFNEKANPEPSKTTHNVPLEVIWTLVPVLILLVIVVPSFRLLYFTDRVVDPEMVVKVTGNQWNWTVEYPDHDGLSFTSFMIADEDIDLDAGQKRLLSVDNPMVLPVDTTIQFDITASDVLHSFAMPAFGIKVDAVPGRMNQTWVRIEKEGTYYGQCSELCGKDHAFMPMEVHAVSKEAFVQWLVKAKAEF